LGSGTIKAHGAKGSVQRLCTSILRCGYKTVRNALVIFWSGRAVTAMWYWFSTCRLPEERCRRT